MKLHGVERVDRNLRAARDAFTLPVQRHIVYQAAKVVRDRARALAPVKTGTLRDSIGISFNAPREMSFSIRHSGVRVFIGPAADVWYAPYVEFGTWKRDPHPFMRPAMDQSRDEVQRVLARGLWSAVVASIKG